MTEHMIEQVRQLSVWLEATDITLLELSGPGQRVRLRRQARDSAPTATPQRPASATPSQSIEQTLVRASSVGFVRHTHPLRKEPLAQVGQQVVAGQTLALLQIGVVLLPVPAPRTGTVSRILTADESPVGFGDPLIEMV